MMTLIGLLTMLQAAAQDLPEPRAQATALRSQIDEALAAVEALEPADPEQEQCVTPKRDALRLIRDVGVRVEGELLDALADGKTQHVSLSLRKLVVAQSRAEQLREEAEACLPDALGAATTTTTLTNGSITDGSETDASAEAAEHPDPPSSSQFE